MNNASVCRFVGALFLGFLLSFVPAASAANTLSYQGRVISGGTAFTGSGQFKFALVSANGSTVYWKNDGTTDAAAPTSLVPLTVTKGIFSVRLGDTSFSNMAAIPSSVFANTSMALRIWFNDGVKGFEQLSPDQTVSDSALTTIRSNSSSNSTSSVSATSVQEELFMLRLQTGAYPSTISGITWSGVAWDVFSSENGVNSTVVSHSNNSFQSGYIDSSSDGFEDNSTYAVTTVQNNGILMKTFPVSNVMVSYASADYFYSSGSDLAGSIVFNYTDGTSSGVGIGVPRGWNTAKAVNPNPAKLVSSVQFYITNTSNYTAVRNIVVLAKQPTQLALNIPASSVPSGFSKFKLILVSSRVTGDAISYSVSDGATSMASLVPGVQYTWTGTGVPATLNISITPSLSAAPLSTKIAAYAVFFE
jgi:hypothetical protein